MKTIYVPQHNKVAAHWECYETLFEIDEKGDLFEVSEDFSKWGLAEKIAYRTAKRGLNGKLVRKFPKFIKKPTSYNWYWLDYNAKYKDYNVISFYFLKLGIKRSIKKELKEKD